MASVLDVSAAPAAPAPPPPHVPAGTASAASTGEPATRRSTRSPAFALAVGFSWGTGPGATASADAPTAVHAAAAPPAASHPAASPSKPASPLVRPAASTADSDSSVLGTASTAPACLAPPVKNSQEEPALFSSLLASSLPPSPRSASTAPAAPAASDDPSSRSDQLGSHWPSTDLPLTSTEPPSWSNYFGPGTAAYASVPASAPLPNAVQPDSALSISSLSSPASAPAFQTPSSSPLYEDLVPPASAPPSTPFGGFSNPVHPPAPQCNQQPSAAAEGAQHGVPLTMLNTQGSSSSLGQENDHHEPNGDGTSHDGLHRPSLLQSSSNGTDDTEPVSPTAEAPVKPGTAKPSGGGGRGGKGRRDTKGLPRQFACTVCGAAFARNHDLRRHARIHMASKPYACPTCRKQFSRKDALNRHLSVKSNCLFRRRPSVTGSIQPGVIPGAGPGGDPSMPQAPLASTDVSSTSHMVVHHPYSLDFTHPGAAAMQRPEPPSGLTMGFGYGHMPSPIYSAPTAADYGHSSRDSPGMYAPGREVPMMSYPSAHMPMMFPDHPSRARSASVPGSNTDLWLGIGPRQTGTHPAGVEPCLSHLGQAEQAPPPPQPHPPPPPPPHGLPHPHHANSHVPLGFLPFGSHPPDGETGPNPAQLWR